MMWYLFYKLYTSTIIHDLKFVNSFNTFLFLLSLVLVYINWGLEAKKWQLLMFSQQKLDFITSYKSVLAGLVSGLFTPNRLGNFIGRLSYLKSNLHSTGIINTTLGNMAQFITTIVFGLIGMLFSLSFIIMPVNIILLISISVLALFISIWLFFKPELILKISIIKKYLPSSILNSINFSTTQTSKLKLAVLLFSVLRYFVFCLQFYLLFLTFGEQTSAYKLLSLIALHYFLTTIIPSPFFGKLFVRESVAVFVFSLINLKLASILAVVFMLWLINLAIPAILGSVLWLKVKNV